MKKTFLFAALMLSASLWAETVTYIDANGQSQSADATEITNTTTTLSAGWYVVLGSDVRTGGLVCNGAVHLILADGAKLTATAVEWGTAAIQVVGADNSIAIYGQTKQTGQLIANAMNFSAAIGGGYQQSGANITINGGIVTANGGYCAAGIGGGSESNGSNITINGGFVVANGGENASGIGAGDNASASNIFVAANLPVKAGAGANPADVIAHTDADIASSLAGKRYVVVGTLPPPEPINNVAYIDVNGQPQTADSVTVITYLTTTLSGWCVVLDNDVATQTLTCNGDVHLILADGAKLTATGIRNWIDDIYLPGILVSGSGNSLTVYGQTAQSGQLIASSELSAAGIGGGDKQPNSNITINGGIVTATGGYTAAGIGGGSNSLGSNITINRGVVTATGGSHGAGIGGGSTGAGSGITINGGTVTANGGDGAAGIGGGYTGSGSNITINGGEVKANGGENAAGIGGGYLGSGSYITINGGTVTATGGTSEDGHGDAIGNATQARTASSNIKVAMTHYVNVGNVNPPVSEIEHDGSDIAGQLAGKRYAVISSVIPYRVNADSVIDAAVSGVTNKAILNVASVAKNKISTATTITNINAIRDKALADLQNAISFYNEGKQEGLAEGIAQGDSLGYARGLAEGIAQGDSLGYARGLAEGIAKGDSLGYARGLAEGIEKGDSLGYTRGLAEGIEKGDSLGYARGLAEGIAQGDSIGYTRGLAEGIEKGRAAVKSELPTDPDGTAGTAVVITKGDKSLTLTNPDRVTYLKKEEE